MSNLEQLVSIIPDYYKLNKTDKTISLLTELISGRYYNHSNKRTFLIQQYKDIVSSLDEEEYSLIEKHIRNLITELITIRNDHKISYSLLSSIIIFSCTQRKQIYYDYEQQILVFASMNKEKYLFHIITAAQMRKKLIGEIHNINLFFIERYLQLSRTNTINYRYLIDFTTNVGCSDKAAILRYLVKCKPFKNDFIINHFIRAHEDLQKYAILL